MDGGPTHWEDQTLCFVQLAWILSSHTFFLALAFAIITIINKLAYIITANMI